MKNYYITSNKYSIQERKTKKQTVYDIVFRVITVDGIEKQKKVVRIHEQGASEESVYRVRGHGMRSDHESTKAKEAR